MSEFLVLQSLADTDSLFLIIADLRILSSQLRRFTKTIAVLQIRVEENIENIDFVNDVKLRLDNVIEKYNDQLSTIQITSKKLLADIINSYRLLVKLLPIPNAIKYNKVLEKNTFIFKCHHAVCNDFLYIYDDLETWLRLIYLAKTFQLIDNYPNGWENLSQAKINELNDIYENFKSISELIEEKSSLNVFSALQNLDKLIISNSARDAAIQKLRMAFDRSNNLLDYYQTYKQCRRCQNWYCKNHLESEEKCLYC